MGLPIRRGLTPTYAVSLLITVLMVAASVVGLLYRSVVYPTDELLRTFVSNDVVSLLIGVPLLLASMGLAWRGRLIGLLAWPGALLFVLYNYIAYVFAVPLSAALLLHLALVMLSAYTFLGLVAAIDGDAVRRRLAGVVPERMAGGVLAALGLLFFLRAIGVIVNALVGGTGLAQTELAVNVSDFLIAPAWILGGVLLWWHKELGYVLGLGLLLGISLLFLALVIFLLVQPILMSAPFALVDVLVVLVMGLVGFVPCFLFARGVASARRSSPS